MKTRTTKKRPQIGYKPDQKTYETLQAISADDYGRPISGIVGIIVGQYLSSTNGKLLKHVKVVPAEDGQAA